ncbi:flagellar motor protein MotB [Pseudomonas sp. RIT-PI-q]|uniref:OmpA/MotB family protein n=1 Tax=Pseudomonas sp. RIT-PI-q TaxID=1690247 RepID=UPI0006CC4C5D|nr:OmpA family protein [Pseudomonas sp. RIT-PI-q]KPG98294.1 flagellar motor protein MotB [Pseudomonas sp. RIT-PI-q]
MREKPSEWISISDLMAGVMAVVMLMLVVSVLQNKAAEAAMRVEKQQMEAARQAEKAQGAATQQTRLSALLEAMRTDLAHGGEGGLIDVDIKNRRLTLPDNAFGRGSACVTPEARQGVTQLSGRGAPFIHDYGQGQVLVEGHTDNVPVSRPVTDFVRYCTVYDDNYTLSAARAREARKLLVLALDGQQSLRVIVAGYGDSRPKPGVDPASAENRRVEVQLVVSQEDRSLEGR